MTLVGPITSALHVNQPKEGKHCGCVVGKIYVGGVTDEASDGEEEEVHCQLLPGLQHVDSSH